MNYFLSVAKAIYTMFIMLCICMLVLATGISIPFERYISYLFLLVFFMTLVTLTITIVIAFFFAVKQEGILRVMKRVGIFFIFSIVLTIIISLIKYNILFSLDFVFLPISLSVLSIFSFFFNYQK